MPSSSSYGSRLFTRRRFLRTAGGLGVAASVGAVLLYDQSTRAETVTRLLVPAGFTPRIVARSGYPASAHSAYPWHLSPDGGDCYAAADGGWVYLSNSEMGDAGMVSALRFDVAGNVIDCYPILSGTRHNCSGGHTPWHSWLSCEEVDDGLVWECDPFNRHAAFALPGLGAFKHESASVDILTHRVYLTEDQPDGCLYRCTPDRVVLDGKTDLRQGSLQVASVTDGQVTWWDLPEPGGRKKPLRRQLAGSAIFHGGEGIDIYGRMLRFISKGDNRVWQIDLRDDRIVEFYNLEARINDVDDLTHSPDGKMLIAEDGAAMRILYFDEIPDPPATLVQLPDHRFSEITGLAFDPGGKRLYFSSQRGNTDNRDDGITFELAGDFSRVDLTSPLVEWNLEHRDLIT